MASDPAAASGRPGAPRDPGNGSRADSRSPHGGRGAPESPYAPPERPREATAVSADGARLHVEVHGPDTGRTVVLLHGWCCSLAFWAPVIRQLTASGHRVVAYDQRGHGRTPAAVAHAYGPAALADDLCAVLDAVLAPGERAVVAGHSMGAMTLVAAAGRRQVEERVAAALLCNTGVRELAARARVLPLGPRRLRMRTHRLLLRARAPLGPVTPLGRAVLRYVTMGRGATRAQTGLVAHMVHGCPPRVRGAWGAVLGELDIWARVPRLTAPTAVVAGSADRLTPAGHARELAGALPHCTGLRELPGAGHMAPVERPEAITEVLHDLVRRYVPDEEARGQAGARTDGPNGEATKEETA